MKKSVSLLIAIAASSFVALAAQAQPALKLLVVDMAKAYDGYYKTVAEGQKLQNDENTAKEMLSKMTAERQTIVDTYKTIADQANNPAITVDAKTKAQVDAQKKIEEIRKKEAEIQEFAQNVQAQLQQQFQTVRSIGLDDLSKIASDIAKRKGATLLVDKSGPTVFGISNIIYSDPAYDITDEVLKEANKDHPVPAPSAPVAAPMAAPAGTTPSTAPAATAPGAESVPPISFPGAAPKK
jgi:outer membrane protein